MVATELAGGVSTKPLVKIRVRRECWLGEDVVLCVLGALGVWWALMASESFGA